MNNAVYYVLVIVAGYFCGCIESGYLVGNHSHNAGLWKR